MTVPEAIDQPQTRGAGRCQPGGDVRVSALGEPAQERDRARDRGEPGARTRHGTRLGIRADNAREPDYQVLVDIQRFDSALGEAVTIDALWSIRRAVGGAPRTGRTSVRETVSGAGFDALAAAHSRALVLVSQDIARAIREP